MVIVMKREVIIGMTRDAIIVMTREAIILPCYLYHDHVIFNDNNSEAVGS
jgi:hypothetical protein